MFGAIGYAVTDPEPQPIPPLPAAAERASGVSGEVRSLDGGRITLVLQNGETREYALPPGVAVEAIRPVQLADIQVGDWLNGGAIPHPQTLLALERLVLLPEPVTP